MNQTAAGARRMSPTNSIAFILLGLMAGSALTGCASFRNLGGFRHRDPMAGAPRLHNASNPQMEEIVAHLNQNTRRIQSWRANSVRISANQWLLSGTLAVEKGNRVRLVVTSGLGKEVDLGSNDERFWVWSRRMDPAFVTCRHENMEVARHSLGIPFEPHWLMQALGVEPLSSAGMKMEVDPSKRQARLIEDVMTAHGRPLRRAVLVDLKNGTVIEHSLYDYDSVRVALARLRGHRVENSDGVVLPHRVLLEWPQNQMSMTMDLGRIQVNPSSIPTEVWEMPDGPGYSIVHLDAGVPPNRIAIRPESAVRLDSIETESTLEGDENSPPELEFERPLDLTGRARLLEEGDNLDPPGGDDEDWTR